MYRKTLFHLLILTVLMVGFFNTSCKKNSSSPTPIAANLSRDTLYNIFKDEYIFTDVIPTYTVVNPRSFVNNDSLFAKLKRYSTNPIDKYSFIDKGGSIASEIGQGVSLGDFGFEANYAGLNDLRVVNVVRNSPAYLLGIRRGWQITSVNNNTNMTYDGGLGQSAANVIRISNAIYNSNSSSFVFLKPDATSVNKTVNAASYQIDPVYLDTVYTYGAKKIGYLVFGSFVDLAKVKTELISIFADFVTKGVTDLVVDLRYNGGGAVNTSEFMANLIAPKNVGADSTKAMYTYTFNSIIQNRTYSNIMKTYKLPPPDQAYSYADIFDSFNYYKTTNYVKAGNLDISNVVFIVTGGTASASELLINNLKPYMNVTLVGKQTYGKPVGFIGIPVGGYDMYTISFKTVNASNQGDYYTGMPIPTRFDKYEDLSLDYGMVQEVYLNNALQALNVTGLPVLKAMKASSGKLDNSRLDKVFKGMIETRLGKIK
jgi:carboxyl-terminal processing protease